MRKAKGFTLIELMTVVAIIGIIAAIAYPSYINSMRKGRRSDGQAALTEAAQSLERCYTEYGNYKGSCSMANTLQYGGLKSQQSYYLVTGTINSTDFTLSAAGQGLQVQDTTCKTMTLNNAGAKTPSDCW
ncbi:MAG: type IV pilin protein [Gammaproteobacteria bacterium]